MLHGLLARLAGAVPRGGRIPAHGAQVTRLKPIGPTVERARFMQQLATWHELRHDLPVEGDPNLGRHKHFLPGV